VKKTINWLLLIALFLAAGIFGCEKDDPFPPEPEPEEIPEASEVNRFIFEGLAVYYYWVADVPYFTDPKFNNEDSLNFHLNKYSDPKELFYSHLYRHNEVDKWSEIFDDYSDLEDWLSGVSETTGIVPMPVQFQNSNDVVGLVLYVLENSPADLAGIKRGDYFTKVNNTSLTVDNFGELVYTNGTKKFQMATISADYVISETGVTYTVESEEIQENPVFLDTVYNIDGSKVGYLVYNGFTSAYDPKLNTSYDLILNNVFEGFKSEGIDKLIIDLRYNLGGSVQTAKYLASMIYSTDKSEVFAKTKYNDYWQNYFIQTEGAESLLDYFQNDILPDTFYTTDENGNIAQMYTTPRTPIASLNLNELYVLTSGNTVSASELLINGLEPYIDVRCIGTNTRGKNVGSATIRDWIDNEGNVNPNHKYAMQPIIAKIANSLDYSEYINGLPPDVEVDEDIRNFRAFGDTYETLLKAALDDIRGASVKSATVRSKNYKMLKIVKGHSALDEEMYFEPKSAPRILLNRGSSGYLQK